MWLYCVVHSFAAVGPDDTTGFRVQAVYEDPHEWPYAGGEPDFPVSMHWAATGWPARKHSSMPQDLALLRAAIEFPQQFSVSGVQAVEMSVIGNKPKFPLLATGAKRTGPSA